MRALNPSQIKAMNEHLTLDHSTLRFSFVGGHRESLIDFEPPNSDGLIVGETYGGNRIEFYSEDISSITYVIVDQRVMSPTDVQAHRARTTDPEPDGPIKIRRRKK